MTRNLDRYFILVGLVFAGLGMVLGNYMGGSGNHTQMPTHAHIMLAGFVFSIIYGVVYRLWPALKSGWLAIAQFALHVFGAICMNTALFLLYGAMAEEATVEPLLILGPLGIMVSWLIFLGLFAVKGRDRTDMSGAGFTAPDLQAAKGSPSGA